jgi:hypothetical protein
MGRVPVIVSSLALLAFGPGCAGSKPWKSSESEVPPVPAGVPTAPLSALARHEPSPVTPASAIAKVANKLTRSPATEMTVLWRNRVDYLPDPARNGEMGPGLVGQLFLFGPNLQFVEANGRLIVALYDESPRPPGQQPNKPECWEFTKETLQKLKTPDERFGMSYALFLPWPTYRPDVTRVRIAVRYDQENGHSLYAPETWITLDNSVPGSGAAAAFWSRSSVVPGGGIGPTPSSASPLPFTPSPASAPPPSPLPSPSPSPSPTGSSAGMAPGGPQEHGTRPTGGLGQSGAGTSPAAPGVGPFAPLAPPPMVNGLPYGALTPAPPGYGTPLPGYGMPLPGVAVAGGANGSGAPAPPASPQTGVSGPGGLQPIVLVAPGSSSR